jgi:hypothetical protein
MTRLRPLIFVLLGLAVGVGLGLYIGWVAWPTEFSEATPTLLEDSYRQDYALMIAAAYAQDGNLPLAQQRINSLGADGEQFLLNMAVEMILQGRDETEIRQVVGLAAALDLYSPAMEPYLPSGGLES